MSVKEKSTRGVAGKKTTEQSGEKFDIIQVGKIWAVRNNNLAKILVYTEKKNEALEIVKDLMSA